MISGIYKWTSPSGKSYIGQSSNLQLRRKQFENFNNIYTTGSKITNARNKYNDISFWSYEVLEYCDLSMLNEREMYWISAFNTFYGNGYNSTLGGDGVKGLFGELNPNYGNSWTDEMKKEFSNNKKEYFKTHDNYWKGKHLAKETCEKIGDFFRNKTYEELYGEEKAKLIKEKISKVHKGRKQNKEWIKKRSSQRIGKPLSEETKRKISNSLIGNVASNRKAVCQYDLDGNLLNTFNSLKEAANITKCNVNGICQCCKGRRDNVKNYIFKYLENG